MASLEQERAFAGTYSVKYPFQGSFLLRFKIRRYFFNGGQNGESLLPRQKELTVLHGDIHHDNVLFSKERGRLAIEPKGLFGERTFDYVDILCNPDKESALSPRRLMRQASVIAKSSGIDIERLLKWTAALAGLSAVWYLNDKVNADQATEILRLALTHL